MTAVSGIAFTLPLDASSDKALVFFSVCYCGLGFSVCTATFLQDCAKIHTCRNTNAKALCMNVFVFRCLTGHDKRRADMSVYVMWFQL